MKASQRSSYKHNESENDPHLKQIYHIYSWIFMGWGCNIDNTDVVEHVKTLPQPEQRTPEWYQIRRESIGASESASIWGDNPYASSNKLLLKKCGYDPHGFKPGPHCL